MKLTRHLLAVLAGVVLVLPFPVQAAPAQPVPVHPFPVRPVVQPVASGLTDAPPDGPLDRLADGPPDQDVRRGLCRPGTPPGAPPTERYYDGNRLLGPEPLPMSAPISPLLVGYQRFGGLEPRELLARHANEAGDGWAYPPALGFVIRHDGRPVKAPQVMQPGFRIDRFGFPGGAFLAPLGTPFAQRALPPSNLSTPERAPLGNYHVYCVLKAFVVDAGPVAPWFAQPGLGTQYKLEPGYLPEAGPLLSVTWLIEHGYLVEERPATFPEHLCGTVVGVSGVDGC